MDYTQLLMIGRAEWWTQTRSATPLQPIKWNASFWIMFTSDDWPGWLMDSNPICHPSPAKKMKCSLLDYVHFGWSARLVNGLKPHPPPLSTQKNEMLIFGLCSTSDDQPGWSMDSNHICHPSPTKKMKCSFFEYIQLLMISQAGRWTQTPSSTPLLPKKWNAHFSNTFNFWWSARLVDGLKPHPPPLSYQKNEMLIFGLCPTSGVGQTGQWTQTPSTTPVQPKKWNASFLDYAQLLMIGWAEWWTQTPSTIPLQPKKWNAHFWITLNFWWSAGLVDGLEPHLPPLSSQKNEMLTFGLRSLWMISQAGQWTQTPSTTPLQPKKMKCSFLDYVKLLMISQAGQWTQTTSATPLLPKKWNAHFSNTFNLWWSARLVDGLKPHLPPLSYQKNEILIFGLCPTSDVGQTGQWTQTPSTTPLHPKKLNPYFCITFNFWCWPDWSMDSNPIHHPSPANKMKCFFLDYVHFWWSARLVDGLKPHPSPLSSQKN